MQKMTLEELKAIKGGAISGAFLLGIGAIVDAISNFVTGMGGLGFVFSNAGQDHSKGSFQFNKNMHFSWDDTKPKGESVPVVEMNSNNFSDYDYQWDNESWNFN